MLRVGVVLFVLLVASTDVAAAQTPGPVTADLRLATGESLGTATFSQLGPEVLISISFSRRGALIGTHGIHLHTTGRCDPPGFESAGAIFNPTGKEHGLQNPRGPMLGDLPDLVIGPDGVATYNLSAPGVTLQRGANSILGRSIVIFSQPDDGGSQPEGNAGARVACGVITAPSSQAADRPNALTAAGIVVLGGLLIAGGVLLRRRP